MPIATGLAIGLGAAAAAGSVGSAAIGAHGASKAAQAQVDAANHAADLQHQDAQQALAFQKQEYSDQQKNLAPWLQTGQGAIKTLSGMVNNGGFPDWKEQFQAPTSVTEQNDPGFQFRLQQGQKALERSAAAKGNLLTGGTAKAEQAFGQDYASNEYGNVYGRALGEYQQRYNQFQNNQANTFNRYATLAGVGQTAANNLNSSGQAAAGNIGNILMTSGQQIGQDFNNAGAARASGYVGSANAYGNMFSNLGQLPLLFSALKGGGGLSSTGGI